jgi:parallel beta-helix repeat protein
VISEPIVIKRFTPTAYNSGTKRLTVSGGGFTGFFDEQQFHIVSIPVQQATGSGFSSVNNHTVTVSSSAFATVVSGDSIETSDGRRAEVLSVSSNTVLTIAGWEAIDTFEPSAAPSTGATWRINRYYAAAGTYVNDTNIDLYNDPINPFTGERLVTEAALTSVGRSCKTFATTIYSTMHINAALNNIAILKSRFRGSRADQISIFSSDSPRIIGNTIEYGFDQGITLTSVTRAVVSGNTFEMAGVSAVVFTGDSNSIVGNTVNTWGTVNRGGHGAFSQEGETKSTTIANNTTTVAAGGAGSGSIYVVNLNAGSLATGSVISGNADGGARTATLNIVSGAGAIVGRDLLSVSGSGAANVSALATTDNVKANSFSLPYDQFVENRALRFIGSGGTQLGRMYAGGGNAIFLQLQTVNDLQFILSDSSLAMRMLGTGDFGFGTASPSARTHVVPRCTGCRGIMTQGIASQTASTFWSIDSDLNLGLTILNNRLRSFNLGTLITDETGSGTESMQISPVSNVYTFASQTNGGTARPFAFTGANVNFGTSLSIGGGTAITKHLSATATLDFANQAAAGCNDLTITVTGAAVGNTVALGMPNDSIVANGNFFAWVSAADTVTVRFCTPVSGDPASGVFRVDVYQH